MTLRDANSTSKIRGVTLPLTSYRSLDDITPEGGTLGGRLGFGIILLNTGFTLLAVQNGVKIAPAETGCERTIFWPNLEVNGTTSHELIVCMKMLHF